MTTMKASDTEEAVSNTSSDKAVPSSETCRAIVIRQAIGMLEAALRTKNDEEVQKLLHVCINLISDVCVMDHGFGAALRAKSKSR